MDFGKRFRFLREAIFGFPEASGRDPFAEAIRVNRKTVEKWESKKQENLPNGETLRRIARTFEESNVNLNWLLTGDGEPFPGARSQFPQMCGPETPYIKGAVVPITQVVQDTEPTFKISEDLMMVTRVLESGTSYAAALHLNIVHFDRAVTAEQKISDLEADNKAIRKGNEQLRTRMDSLEQAMEQLMAKQMATQENRKTGTHA